MHRAHCHLLLVSVFIISNTIKLTTFDRRDEIAIMKMVGATNGFIRWPFVYEGFMIGLLSAVLGFGLQWLLYESVAKSLAMSDRLQLLTIVDFTSIWRPVAAIFAAAGILIGVGGSLTAIRKFLHVREADDEQKKIARILLVLAVFASLTLTELTPLSWCRTPPPSRRRISTSSRTSSAA